MSLLSIPTIRINKQIGFECDVRNDLLKAVVTE